MTEDKRDTSERRARIIEAARPIFQRLMGKVEPTSFPGSRQGDIRDTWRLARFAAIVQLELEDAFMEGKKIDE